MVYLYSKLYASIIFNEDESYRYEYLMKNKCKIYGLDKDMSIQIIKNILDNLNFIK